MHQSFFLQFYLGGATLEVSRRNLLKATIAGAGLSLAGCGYDVQSVQSAVNDFKLDDANEYTSICTFCACGCGMVGYVKEGKMINLEGDSDHIVNEGGLCSKGASMSVIPNSEGRVLTPKYRAPKSNKWEDISWDEALDKIASKIKQVRDDNWIAQETENGKTYNVNRCDALSFVGGAQVHNEECYLITKMTRMLGVSFLEHQARLCHSSTVPALTAAFGRGAMTNTWQDLKNAKAILIEGSNAAENHPMSAKWIMRAKANGATVIHVDPRYTRTSKLADIHAQIRPGTDIAFLGAIINYILETNSYDENYLLTHTNAAMLVSKDYDFNEGLFSGYNEEKHSYDKKKWAYQLDASGKPIVGTLTDPDSVMMKMRDFYKRYDLETASNITGIPAEDIKKIAEVMINNRPGTVMYALGMTQHTVGVQNIRSFTVMQFLLGNVGKPGSGINALRGEPNVQGSTDFAVLFNYFPGYLSTPNHRQQTLDEWTKSSGTFRRKFMVNLMKSWFGENAAAENDFCYSLMPKINANQNYSIYRIFETALESKMKFLYITGQNPLVTSPNLNIVQAGLEKLEMLVVADPFETETASFWQKREGVDPQNIDTEVILLPAASFLEKEGTLINSSRLVQWRYAGLKPLGEAKPDIEIIDLLFQKIREKYASSTEEKDKIFKLANWNYPENERSDAVLKEINGYNTKTGKLLNGIGEIQADGSTSTGCWVYAGVYANGENQTLRKDFRTDPGNLGIFPKYAWTWPGNIHILYNRASCDKNGKPYDENNKLIWWDENAKKWTGYDVPDVPTATDGPNTANGQKPFRMSGEGVGRLFGGTYADPETQGALPRDVSYVTSDGPFPEFYEPVESPTKNILHENVASNPCLIYPRVKGFQEIGDKKDFPYVLCTSAVSEHWCSGAYTRNVPWLNELVKETFIEMPHALADKLGVKNGEKVKVNSARGEVVVKAMVTNRIHTLNINGEECTVVWMPYNWGFKGLSTAASTNLLTIDAGDPNTWIQETKACLVNVTKAGV